MPEIFDYESGKTSINEVQELFEKWESISKKLEEMETDGVYRYLDGTDMFSEGERILEFYTFYALCRRYGAGFVSDKVEEELVLIPLCDTEGKLFGELTAYALLFANCKNEKAVNSYLKQMIYQLDWDGNVTVNPSVSGEEFMGIYLEKLSTEVYMGNKDDIVTNGAGKLSKLYDLLTVSLDSTEMNLRV